MKKAIIPSIFLVAIMGACMVAKQYERPAVMGKAVPAVTKFAKTASCQGSCFRAPPMVITN